MVRVARVLLSEVSRVALLLQGCGEDGAKGQRRPLGRSRTRSPVPHPSYSSAHPQPPGSPSAPRSACARFRFRKVALVLTQGRKVDCEKRDR